MFFWGQNVGPDALPGRIFYLNITEPADIAGAYLTAPAEFGPSIYDQALAGKIVQVVDAGGTNPNDGCQIIQNGADLTGNIALIDKGDCEFSFQAWTAELAGAVGVIICNDTDDLNPIELGTFGNNVHVPTIMIGQTDCQTIKMALDQPVSAFMDTLSFAIGPLPGPAGRDSDFDNMVIVHEYGHGISIRLTGGPSQGRDCLFGPSGGPNPKTGSEGWSDFFGLVLTATADMTPEMPRTVGNYSDSQPVDGAGIRNYPYSTDFAVNPHTYWDLSTTSQVHAVGEIWATILWDLYWAFVEEYGFDPDFYNGTGGNNRVLQLVVDGLKMQPCQPTFIDSRNAILAADSADFNGENHCLIWQTFARRGLGYGAGPDGIESFATAPECDTALKMTFEGTETVDAGDPITYRFTLRHDVPGAEIDLSLTDLLPPGTDFDPASATCANDLSGDLLTFPLPAMAAGTVADCTFELGTPAGPVSLPGFGDDFENGTSKWKKTANSGGSIFLPNGANPHSGFTALKANSSDKACDQLAILKDPVTLTGTHPGLVFWHYFNTPINEDGGVLEISTDGGDTWEDLGDLIIFNPYNTTLAADTTNALAGRNAFSGLSGGYIRTIVDLTPYAGQPLQIRFRFGCNDGHGKDGWFIDDVQFYDHLEVILNEACATDGDLEICREVATILLGDPTATRDLTRREGFHLSPNPTSGNLTLRLDQPRLVEGQIEILDLLGRTQYTQSLTPGTNRQMLSPGDLPAGIYVLRVLENGAPVWVQKFVRE
ncbi:MAG: T9SS C-terminal target domain-containing protein [Bacteroidetes bacterium]|nr:MAG: T9SS C-terminal target domain-containing protein [Bacteroidota bacterium]